MGARMGSAFSKNNNPGVTKAKVNATTSFLSLPKERRERLNTVEITASNTVDADDDDVESEQHEAKTAQTSEINEIFDEKERLHLTQERRATRRDIFDFIEASKRDRLLIDHKADAESVTSKDDDTNSMDADDSAYLVPVKVNFGAYRVCILIAVYALVCT